MKLYDYIWLVPLFSPSSGAIFNGFVSNRRGLSKKTTQSVALLGAGAAWIYGWAAVLQWYFTEDHTKAYVVKAFTWITGGNLTIADGSTAAVDISASFQIDPLSAVMVGFVTFVGFLIHLYSVGYMHGEPDRDYARYFAYLNLFMFAMLTLITGSNLPVLFVGWEGVGLCSYLLIGFYFEKGCVCGGGHESLHRQPHRRLRLSARHLLRLLLLRDLGVPGPLRCDGRRSRRPLRRRGDHHRPAALCRRHG